MSADIAALSLRYHIAFPKAFPFYLLWMKMRMLSSVWELENPDEPMEGVKCTVIEGKHLLLPQISYSCSASTFPA